MMRKLTVMGWTALVALCAAPAFGVTIEIAAGAVADGKSAVNVVLRSEGGNVGGMQNDILFDTTKVNLPSATACKINAEIGTSPAGCEEDPVTGACKTLSRNLASCGATPTPPGCEGQPATVSRFRGIVAATAVPNNNAIPDGSVLFTCDFNIVDAAGLPATLTNSNVVASDPFGVRLTATGTNGTIGVGPVTLTPTPTTGGVTPTPTVAPVGCTAGVCVNVGTAVATGAKVSVDIVVTGNNVGGAQNDILFDTTKVNLPSATACKVNAGIGTSDPGCEEDPVVGACKTLSRNLASCGASPTPPGCEGQPATVSRFRGIVAATAVPNNNPIPTGSVLYTCEFDVVNAAGLPAALTNSNIVASDPFGTRLESGGANGAINPDGVVIDDTPTPTATVAVVPTDTPTVAPTATNTPVTPVVTNTIAPTATSTPVPATRTATATPTGVPFEDDDDGCAIAGNGTSNSRAWILLIPAFGLVALRRRRRA